MQSSDDKRLLAPVLDRLLSSTEQRDFSQPHQVLRQLRESVRRDMENLFNTRFCCVSPPEELPHLKDSLLNYGLPDLSTINMSSSESRKSFCRQIERTILTFEPRVRSAKVTCDDGIDNESPTIRFRVEAVLHANPAPELIVFDSSLDTVTQTVDVSEIR